jgi:small subunit ribosomal protein S21
MLIIEVKEKESIDRALKRYKRKYIQTGVRQEIMRRKRYVKPSAQRRNEVLKAIYRRQKEEELDN